MADYSDDRRFIPSKAEPCNVAETLRKSGAEILVSFLPVGSEKAARFYASACLEAGVSLINCMPVFIGQIQQGREIRKGKHTNNRSD
jgi:myo-inositol-1-phosphate synthase